MSLESLGMFLLLSMQLVRQKVEVEAQYVSSFLLFFFSDNVFIFEGIFDF